MAATLFRGMKKSGKEAIDGKLLHLVRSDGLSVPVGAYCLSVCLSVCHIPVLYRKGCTD